MKKKRRIVLLIQIILVVLSVFLLIQYTNKQVELTDVYVYSRDINDVSDKLTKEDVKKVSIPITAISKDFALKEEEIVGKHVDSKVRAGQYVYKNQLIELDEVDVFETMDLSEYRKISLPISFVDGFAGNIKRGDRVDLVYTGEGLKVDEESLEDKEYKYSKVFMQDVLVYSVNTDDGFKFVDRSQYTPNAFDEDEEEEIDDSEIATITLAVTLEQAEEIEVRTNAGIVRFLGRFNESESYETLGYTIGEYDEIQSGQGCGEVEIEKNIEENTEEEIEETKKTEDMGKTEKKAEKVEEVEKPKDVKKTKKTKKPDTLDEVED